MGVIELIDPTASEASTTMKKPCHFEHCGMRLVR
jgi:hypothetical protein